MNARALLEHGLSGLALLDLDPSHAGGEIDTLRKDFPHAQILAEKIDVTNAVDVVEVIDRIGQVFECIDILICFAGVVGCQHAVDMSAPEWKRTLDVNTTGAFLCAQAVAKYVSELHHSTLEHRSDISPLEFKSASVLPSQSFSSPPSPPTVPTSHNLKPPTTLPKPRL